MVTVILDSEPDCDFSRSIMEFRLTYSGPILGASRNETRAAHKHEIRKVFHKQLKRLWEVHPFLSETTALNPDDFVRTRNSGNLLDNKIRNYQNFGNFIPLVTENDSLICDLRILFIRPDVPGGLLKSGDLDNRLKTIFDALRVPKTRDEMGGADLDAHEDPFFCLVDDDRLITHISIETDVLLEPIYPESQEIGVNDARLVIQVKIRPYKLTMDNIDFS